MKSLMDFKRKIYFDNDNEFFRISLVPPTPLLTHVTRSKTLGANAFYFIYSSLQLVLSLSVSVSLSLCVCVGVFAFCVFFSFIAAAKVFNERALTTPEPMPETETESETDAMARFPFRLEERFLYEVNTRNTFTSSNTLN